MINTLQRKTLEYVSLNTYSHIILQLCESIENDLCTLESLKEQSFKLTRTKENEKELLTKIDKNG